MAIFKLAICPLLNTVTILLSHLLRDHWSDIRNFPEMFRRNFVETLHMNSSQCLDVAAWKRFWSVDEHGRTAAIFKIANCPLLNTVTIPLSPSSETTGRIFSSLSQRLIWWAYRIGRPSSSTVHHRPHSLNIFSSETTGPVKVKFHMALLWDGEIRLFADDCVCYREIKDEEDTIKLQRDIGRLGSWARTWGMRFQPVKCNMIQLTRKRIKKIHASYTLEGTDLENVENIKYLGVTITSDLRWNTHVSNVCTKANRTLGFLRRNLYSCPQEVKEAAYTGLVRPVLDYGSSVWDPPGVVLQEELESVQKRAARFVTGNYNYETGSMTGILGQLKWESLKKRRKDNRLILLYKGLKGKASIPTDDLIPKTRCCRNQHSVAFQTPIANTDVYKGSFFPQTIRDWECPPRFSDLICWRCRGLCC